MNSIRKIVLIGLLLVGSCCCYSNTDPNQNIAPLGTATSSSGYAPLVNDNSYFKRWSSDDLTDQWVLIELDEIYDVSRIVLYWEVANAKRYTLSVSTDSLVWTTMVSAENKMGGREEHFFESTQAKYVRLILVERGTEWNYSLREFEIYAGATPENTQTQYSDMMKYQVRAESFEAFQIGAYDKQISGDYWVWGAGKHIVSNNASTDGEKGILSEGSGYGGGINLVFDGQIKRNAIYEVHFDYKIAEDNQEMTFKSNFPHKDEEGTQFWYLATSSDGPGFYEGESTEFKSVYFTHYTPDYNFTDALIQLEYATEKTGEHKLFLDNIRIYEVVPKAPISPSIKTHPSDRVGIKGGDLTLAVEPTGPIPFSYKWYKNDELVQESNKAFISLNDLDKSQEGDKYFVIVSNDFGSVTSETATVSIIDQPAESIELSETEITLMVGESKNINVTIGPENAVDQSYSLTSENNEIVGVSNGKTLTAISAGKTVVLVATSNPEVYVELNVTVIAPEIITNVKEEPFVWSVYPNPAVDFITVESSFLMGEIRFIDLSGMLLITRKVTTQQALINISDLKCGMCIVEVIDALGVVKQNRKLFIKY